MKHTSKYIAIILLSFLISGCATKENIAPKIDSEANITIDTNISTVTQKQTFVDKNITKAEANSTSSFGDASDFDAEFATPANEAENKTDYLEPYNRAMTTFNDKLITHVLNPIAKGYAKVIPEGGRVAISNFLENLGFPMRFANNLLQFKLKNSYDEAHRFVVNTIFGLGGFFDPATKALGIEKHDEDFGQTLGYYGIPDGPYIVLPLLGPSNLRDIIGMVGDSYIDPLSSTKANIIHYKIPQKFYEELGIITVQKVDDFSLNLGAYEALKSGSLDLYEFLRNVYLQKREQEIKE